VDYRDWAKNSLWTRLANYTQISGAFVPCDATTTPGQAGVGIAAPLIDETNWETNPDAVQSYINGLAPFFDALRMQDAPATAVPWPQGQTIGTADQFGAIQAWVTSRISRDEGRFAQFEQKLSADQRKVLDPDLTDYKTKLDAYEGAFSHLSYQDVVALAPTAVPSINTAANYPPYKAAALALNNESAAYNRVSNDIELNALESQNLPSVVSVNVPTASSKWPPSEKLGSTAVIQQVQQAVAASVVGDKAALKTFQEQLDSSEANISADVEKAMSLLDTFNQSANSLTLDNASTQLKKIQTNFDAVNAGYQTIATDYKALKGLTLEQKLTNYVSAYGTQASAYYWNRFKLDFAFGSGWGTVNNDYKDLFTTGSQVWSTLSLPFNQPTFKYNPNTSNFKTPSISGITLYGSLVWDDRTFKSGAYTADGSGFQAGIRFKYGSPVFNGFAEGLNKSTYLGSKTTSADQWDIGFEHQIAKKQWVQLSFGNDIKNPSGTAFGLNYAYNFSTSPTLNLSGAPSKSATSPGTQ
jgi:hypothetical protein